MRTLRANLVATVRQLTVSLVVGLGALAMGAGCSQTGQSEQHPSYPKAPAMPQMQPSSYASERDTTPRPEATPTSQQPVSITGLVPYHDRFDPSGWSGTSTPKATGGGPTDNSDTAAPNAAQGLNPDEKPQPPAPPAKNDDLIDEYQ